MANFGWAYINCSDTGSVSGNANGPSASVQYMTGTADTFSSGSANFTFQSANNLLELTGTLSVAGGGAFSGPSATFATFSASDTTPAVSSANLFKTHASSQTLTMFDDGIAGQIITIISTDDITYDVTGTNLKGGTANIVTATGDVTQWVFDGTDWYLLAWMDISADLSSGGF